MTKNTRRFELKLGRVGLILFLLGMSGLLFGFFLLGVTVGKNIDTYPEKMARFLPDRIKTLVNRLSPDATEPAVTMRNVPEQDKPEKEKPEKEKPEPALTFYDKLAKRKSGQKGTATDGMILQKEPVAVVKERPPPHETQAMAPKSEKPVMAVRDEPPITEKSAVRGKFIVQVVSYQEKNKAEAMIKIISAMGYAARTEVTELPDKGKWFRVVMGEFSNRSEAQAAVDALSGKTKGLNCVIRSIESTGD